MRKTLEQYLAGLTGEQMSAAMLKFWAQAGGMETGAETLEQWRAGQLRIRFELVARQQPAITPLVGTLVKKLVIKPYRAKSIAHAIKLGKYNNANSSSAKLVIKSITRIFADDDVCLTEKVIVDLFQYDRNWSYYEVMAWAKENGNKKPILPKHIFGISIQHPKEQRKTPIVAIGSVWRSHMLYLCGNSNWRCLNRCSVASGWNRYGLVGFLSE